MSKTILITGSTDGIGLMTAKSLAAQGHTILLHGRSQAKLDAAQAQIAFETEAYLADMSKLSDVEAMASQILERHDTIDVLINNAGVYKLPQGRTPEGLDIRFIVNTFAPWILTQRLLPVIPQDGRIVNLSSAAQAEINLPAMRGELALDDFGAYAQSKLALTIWSQELAKSLPNGPVVLAVNPGSLLASKMVKEGFGVAGNDLRIGVDILTRAALAASFATASGRYFDNDSGGFADPHAAALDPSHAHAVMQTMEATIAAMT